MKQNYFSFYLSHFRRFYSANIDELFLERGEVNFSFEYKNKNQLNDISDIVSIDHKTNAELHMLMQIKKSSLNF